jgi:hypothetical protein
MKAVLAMIVLGLGVAVARAEISFTQVRLGKVLVSLPAGWPTRGPAVPVWLHLHGAPAVVERNFAAIEAPGVLVNLTLPGLSKVYADHFAAPEVFPALLREVELVLRRAAPGTEWTLGRVTVSSFSAGFGGVRQLLRQPEAFDRIATLVMADSIYCGYAGDAKARRVDADLMAGFLRFARLAVDGKKRMLVSHTQQVPDGYASTTEAANFLIAECGGRRIAGEKEWKPGLRELSHWGRGGLEIIGFAGERPEDHMEHLRALGLFLAAARAGEPRGGN